MVGPYPYYKAPGIVKSDFFQRGPPYYHVQTIGAVCAEDQHVEAEVQIHENVDGF